ncbi:MAG: hypothetical protein WCO48_01235 [Candidatus Taylorbacteria bacterium]
MANGQCCKHCGWPEAAHMMFKQAALATPPRENPKHQVPVEGYEHALKDCQGFSAEDESEESKKKMPP